MSDLTRPPASPTPPPGPGDLAKHLRDDVALMLGDLIYGKCETCGEYGFSSSHKCPPAWQVWVGWNIATGPEWPADFDAEEASTVYAVDAGYAAERCWQQDDDGDSCSEEDFWVRPLGSEDKPTKFLVTREYEPTYTAREIAAKE